MPYHIYVWVNRVWWVSCPGSFVWKESWRETTTGHSSLYTTLGGDTTIYFKVPYANVWLIILFIAAKLVCRASVGGTRLNFWNINKYLGHEPQMIQANFSSSCVISWIQLWLLPKTLRLSEVSSVILMLNSIGWAWTRNYASLRYVGK